MRRRSSAKLFRVIACEERGGRRRREGISKSLRKIKISAAGCVSYEVWGAGLCIWVGDEGGWKKGVG